MSQKSDWVWVTRDHYIAPDNVCGIWPLKRPVPTVNEYKYPKATWRVWKQGDQTAGTICAARLKRLGVNIGGGECKKVRFTAEVIDE